jgi:NIMA (never in mitosis gene a)-related kinase
LNLRIIDKAQRKLYIIMEYCEQGDLKKLIDKSKKKNDFIAEDVIWKIFMQMLMGLQACHNRKEGKIIHRDIKPANVFLDRNNNIKIGDFGLSRLLSKDSVFIKTSVGTPFYMSPEQI